MVKEISCSLKERKRTHGSQGPEPSITNYDHPTSLALERRLYIHVYSPRKRKTNASLFLSLSLSLSGGIDMYVESPF